MILKMHGRVILPCGLIVVPYQELLTDKLQKSGLWIRSFLEVPPTTTVLLVVLKHFTVPLLLTHQVVYNLLFGLTGLQILLNILLV